MDTTQIVQVISSLGFPIVMCAALFWYIIQQREEHKEEINKMSEALNNNTLAIQKLLDELEKDKV